MRYCLIFLLILSSNYCLNAQTNKFRNYTSDDGLPNNICYHITTDSLGYIIVATDDGLARFNGDKFEVFRTEEGLLSNFPIYMDVEPDNKIWVGSWKGGINYLDKDSIYSPVPMRDLSNVSYLQKEGNLLLVSDQKYYFRLFQKIDNSWEKIDEHYDFKFKSVSGGKKKLVKATVLDRKFTLKTMINSDNQIVIYSIIPGLWIYEKGGTVRPFMENITAGDTVSYFNIDKQDHYWIASRGKIKEILPNGSINIYDNLPEKKIFRILKKSSSELFFITGYDGFSSYGFFKLNPQNNKLTDLTSIIGNQIIPVDMTLDFENNLWITTHNNGVFTLLNHPFKEITATADKAIHSLCMDKNGMLYAGTQAGLLQITEEDRAELIKTPENKNLNIYGVIPYKEGILFYGEDEFTKLISLNTLVRGKTRRLLKEAIINFLISPDDHKLVTESYGNIQIFSGPDFTEIKHAFFENKLILMTQFFKHQNKIGVATNKGVFFLENNELIQPNTHKWAKLLEGTSITSAVDDEDVLWLGSKKGLIRIKDDIITYFNVSDGLISNSINALYMDSQNRLWIGTPQGFSIYENNQFYSFNKSLGLSSSEIKCFQEDKKGFMWIGTGSGLNKVALSKINKRIPPPQLYIKEVSVNEEVIEMDKVFFLKGGQNIQIDFDVISFGYNAGLRYQTRLNRGKWTGIKQLSISFQGLQYGNYQLDFRARKINSDWSPIQTIEFQVLRPFRESATAFILYGLLLILIIVLVVKLRLKKLVNEKEKLERTVSLRTQDLEKQKLEISNQAEKLKEMDQVKSNFFSNISHEFRTPLTLIKGPAEKIKEQSTDPLSVKYSTLILQNSERLLKMINELLQLAKIENGKIPFHPSSGNIALFSSKITDSFEFATEEKNITLSFVNYPGDYKIDFDREIVETVLINILGNAIKFTPPDGKIEVSINDSGKFILLSIQDSGIGISQEELPNIFEKYYMTRSGESKPEKGSGIGLSLVKELIEIHSGSIEVTSSINQGTTFHISIPKKSVNTEELLHVQHDQPIKEIIRPEEEAPQSDIQILIVEDHADLRSFIADSLPSGFIIKEAATGKEGLKMANSFIPDLIISDIMMPEMNGFEMLQELRSSEATSHIPVIMLTAKSSMEVKLKALESGVNDYLTKPFNSSELLHRVQNTLNTIAQIKSKFNLAVSKPKLVLEPSQITTTSVDERFIEKAIQIVEDHMNNSNLDVQLFCTEIGMSKTTLHRKLKALTGKSTTEFIRTIRIKRAAQLLENQFGRVDEISTMVGFNDISFFNRSFKKQFGCSPTQYVEKA